MTNKDVHSQRIEAALKAIKHLHEDVKETAENQRKQTLDAAVIRSRLKKVATLRVKEGKLTAAGLNALRETLGLADAFIERVDPARVEDALAKISQHTSSELASIKGSPQARGGQAGLPGLRTGRDQGQPISSCRALVRSPAGNQGAGADGFHSSPTEGGAKGYKGQKGEEGRQAETAGPVSGQD